MIYLCFLVEINCAIDQSLSVFSNCLTKSCHVNITTNMFLCFCITLDIFLPQIQIYLLLLPELLHVRTTLPHLFLYMICELYCQQNTVTKLLFSFVFRMFAKKLMIDYLIKFGGLYFQNLIQ